mmetsp:Transcript_13436/g.40635  ORF Transcript_13436/g.40635 Transcript_13436/m.40635 type:complete len:221 (-) Transcript_13436:25-687(-)
MREGLLQRLVDDSVSGRGGDRATVGAAEEGVCGGARFGLRSSLVGRRLQGEVPRRHDRLGRTTPQRGPRLLRLAGPRPDPGPDFDHLGRPARDGRRFLPRKKNSAHPRARQRLQRDARRPRLDLPARRRRRRVRVRPRRLRWLALHHRQRTPHPGASSSFFACSFGRFLRTRRARPSAASRASRWTPCARRRRSNVSSSFFACGGSVVLRKAKRLMIAVL